MGAVPKLILMALALVIVSAIFFLLAYIGLHWYETRSLTYVGMLDKQPVAAAIQIYHDVISGQNWRRAGLAAAGAAGAVAILGIIGFLLKPKVSNDAKFLSMSDMDKAGLTTRGGVFIGRGGGRVTQAFGRFVERGSNKVRWSRPKLAGGKKLWVDGDDVGGFVVGPPRSGKGAGLIIPNALMWPDSLVVLDMRGETYQATAGHRASFTKVVRFSPADDKGETECYNPLDFISLDRTKRDIDIRNIAAALFPRPATGDTYWVDDGRLLFSGVISYVMESPRIADNARTLRTALAIMNGLNKPFLEWIEDVRTNERQEVSDYTLQLLSPFADMSDKQFSGLFGSVRTGLAPFMNERLLKATDRSTFDLRNLKRERVSVYLDFRIDQIRSIGPMFNVLITQLMMFMSQSVPGPGEHRVLMLLDEFQNLGKLENVMETATILGGYGVPTWFFVQSLKSVDTIYREEGRKTLVNSARVQIFFGAQDAEDLKYVSDTLGERTELQKDVSRTAATMFDMHHAKTTHWKEARRPLMRADEIRTMDRNRCLIIPRGSHAIYGTRNWYFADAELSKLAWKPLPAFKSPVGSIDTKAAAAPSAQSEAQRAAASRNIDIVPARTIARTADNGNARARGSIFMKMTANTPRPKVQPLTRMAKAAAPVAAAAAAPVDEAKTIDFSALTTAARSSGQNAEARALNLRLAQAFSAVEATAVAESTDPAASAEALARVAKVLDDVMAP